MQTLIFATVKFNAKNAQSQFEPEFSTIVTTDDGNTQRLYWKAGGVADHLQAGDVVAIEFVKGKWRLSRTQAPELLQRLEARRTPAPTANTVNGAATTVKQATTVEDDCTEMVLIFSHLRRAASPLPQGSLPQIPDDCIQAMSCTIWIQRNRR